MAAPQNRVWVTGYKPSWCERSTRYILPTGGRSCRIWRKRELPENTEFFRLYRMPGDERSWFSPDGTIGNTTRCPSSRA